MSDESWSDNLREITDIERDDHYYLNDGHRCYYFGDYTARAGWSHSSTNQIISNLKKSPLTRGTAQWRHKLRTIGKIGALIRANLDVNALGNVTFVPAPPSKPADHPEYDDRMLLVGQSIGAEADVRCLLETANARQAAHLQEDRPGPDALAEGMTFDADAIAVRPVGPSIVVLDDVLVTGATMVACTRLLAARFPDSTVFGMFVARRVPQRNLAADDFDC